MAGHLMTREDYEKRKAHLEYLKSTRTLEIAEMLKIARGFGDLSENAEYDAAKDEQSKNEHDIALLEEELRTAQIIERPVSGKISNESPIGGALFGHTVGDVVPVTTPGGVIHLEIVSID